MSEEFNEENVTMADLEDHFDDANPWNVVQSYLEKGTELHSMDWHHQNDLPDLP